MKILYINNHSLEKFQNRSNGLINNFLKEDNDNRKLKIMYGLETSKKGFEFVKPILIVRDKWFLPMRIFEKDGIYYYKILSVLYDIQYFSSINLNFGYHTKPKNIQFNLIEEKDMFFDDNYKNIDFNPEDYEWILEETNEKEDKKIKLSGDKSNKILREKKLPLKIKTFREKVIKIF